MSHPVGAERPDSATEPVHAIDDIATNVVSKLTPSFLPRPIP